jgi:hypothetical protein
MNDRTLVELSHDAKTAFESRNFQEASNCLAEAVSRFPQPEGSRLKQGSDGSIVIGVKQAMVVNGEPVVGPDGEYVTREVEKSVVVDDEEE